ncbi:hypothetical protein VP1G_08205 [Cytospora mali]|uniref:SnoaL-like domain-containing protein n=1 Tax=Cytospora mali TaxID=578113 RepID=A0A194VAJ0_CYTMA|nr:hypothetical protein VP1G_08205 [Valsa mali var. pyri (nom. inval.)]
MDLVLPSQLTGALTQREAIADALYRAVLAFDHADEALLLSAVTEDLSAEIRDSSAKGIQEFKAMVFDRVSKLDTTHFLSKMRVTVESATEAKATCSAMAQHIRPSKGFGQVMNKFTSGGGDCTFANRSKLTICGTSRVGRRTSFG